MSGPSPTNYCTPPPPPAQVSGPQMQPIMNYGPPSGPGYGHPSMNQSMGPPQGPLQQLQALQPPQQQQQQSLPPPPQQQPPPQSPQPPPQAMSPAMNGDYMQSSSPYPESKLNPQQVSQLRYQIMAYRLLARNQPIPEHINAAIQGKRQLQGPQMAGPPTGPPMSMGPPPPPPPQGGQQQWRPPQGLDIMIYLY